MSCEWKFLSLESISGVREWVHKAHCRHINIPIGLTSICSRLLFIIITIIVCHRIASIDRSSNQMESTFTSHMMRMTFYTNQITWTLSMNTELCIHTYTLCASVNEIIWKKKKNIVRCSRCNATSQVNSVAHCKIYGTRLYSKWWRAHGGGSVEKKTRTSHPSR